jgi:two-component system phosphate regulon response regulator OmpR
MPDTQRVLVVDDDADVRELLRDYLSDQGYEVYDADSAAAARESLGTQVPDIALLDVGLAGEDGLSLARYIRERFDIGIIMISGAGETLDRIVGLEVGADDYVSKPFDPRELRARLKSVLRRYQRNGGESVAPHTDAATAETRRMPVGACVLDLDTRQLFDASGAETPLTSMEFDLLKVFIERPNRPLSRDQLLTLTQNRDWDPFDRSIDIRIARLRRKIEPDAEQPRVIRTLRGVGYMYVPPGA